MTALNPEVLRLLEIIRNGTASSPPSSTTQQQQQQPGQEPTSQPPNPYLQGIIPSTSGILTPSTTTTTTTPTPTTSIQATQDPRLARPPLPLPQSQQPPHTQQQQIQPQRPPTTTTTTPDPRSITTYPSALRYITTTLLPAHPTLLPRLRRLRQNQHSNERQWHRSRSELVGKFGRRRRDVGRVRSVLVGLSGVAGGAGVGGGSSGKGIGEKEKESEKERERERKELEEIDRAERDELAAFDGKVWRAARVMERQVARELEGWGVPGFVIGRREGPDVGPDADGDKVDAAVRKLRGQIMDFLGDLVGEEQEEEAVEGAVVAGGDTPMGGLGG